MEAATHDQVNLLRLVRRLEKSISTESDWDDVAANQRERVWLQASGALQKVKYGRKLLRTIEQYDPDPTLTKQRQRQDSRTKLDRVELFMTEVQKRTEPQQLRPEPVLPTIPVPIAPLLPSQTGKSLLAVNEGVEPPSEQPTSSTSAPMSRNDISDLSSPRSAPSPSDLSLPVSSLLPVNPTPPPSFAPPSTSTAISTHDSSNALTPRKHLQTSNALQEELTAQLAQMATQLKRNATHFSDSLAKDQAVVEETHEKLESNFGVMLKERVRLRDFRGKSGSTTCMVVGIVIAVLALFMAMVSIIRFSGR
ncbi:hypothetical protein AGABI2DRAFT_187306 [Agaricus bisporus var. bisporus H97]|uniref:hypothetical protein n=1 Tax=Agaricus bisporus var. bisporus (strain H97 / ATCC MYA-4626 / FGSC 10389) TaxID=936046 RepID=UPI00029F70E2|nr:hypothetical protein AGABI2DRAFT_187306 [Agaricus bisporus var. bisporus H97]EKV44519.1 hypothetical protein AGABI2DRAFT_187306 [Agaricus bisporus var. bisporus H97]